jgi:hypothetical protein
VVDFGFQNVKWYDLVHFSTKVVVLCYSLPLGWAIASCSWNSGRRRTEEAKKKKKICYTPFGCMELGQETRIPEFGTEFWRLEWHGN